MAKRFVNDSFWTDPEVKPLSFRTKGLFLYFITNPHGHISGIYYLPVSTIQEETGLSAKELKQEIHTLSVDYRHTLYHPNFSVVWVRKMLQHQVFNDKVKTNIENHLLTLHKCPLIQDFLDYYDSLSIEYPYSLSQKNPTTTAGLVLGLVSKDEDKDNIQSGKPDLTSFQKQSNEAIDYLNQVIGSTFPHNSQSNKFLTARLKEGYTLEDFKIVIDLKTKEWINDPDMRKYLRLSTLFNAEKFEGYLQEAKRKPIEKISKEESLHWDPDLRLYWKDGIYYKDKFGKEKADV